MPMTILPDEAALHAEIERNRRRRFLGVYIAAVAAALFLVAASYSLPMMHGDGFTPVTATIVAVETDPASGDTVMTSEFIDTSGTRRRGKETAAYHYAPGDPKVGQAIEYIYKTSALTGDFHATPRADVFLRWTFGVPGLLLAILAIVVAWLVLRQRTFRRELVRSGRRVPGQTHAIRAKTLIFPGEGNSAQAAPMWRLEARYFEPAESGFRDCHSDWQHGEAPELLEQTPVPPLLLDARDPERYWLPLGSLAPP